MLTLSHDHYAYSMKFNEIGFQLEPSVLCDIDEGKRKITSQSQAAYWKDKDEEYLAFCDTSHCCCVRTFKETIAASSATANREYKLIRVPSAEFLGLSTHPVTCYVSRNVNLFTSGLVPVDAVESYLYKIRAAILEAWESKDNSPCNSLPSIVSLFDRNSIDTITVQVDKEIQFNSWVFKQINAELEGQGFVVDDDKINKLIVPNVCEFSTSKPDCVIYHPTSLCEKRLSGFAISVCDNENLSGDSSDEFEDAERAKGCSFEVKKKDLNNAAINECVYGMYGAATKLITMALELGKIVEKVEMYGLLVAMEDTDAAFLFKLDMNFLHSSCVFYMCCKKYKFIDGTNMILQKLR